MATIAQLNRKLAHTGVECYKGDGYFYFVEVREDIALDKVPPSVYTMRFNDLTLQQWVDHVEAHQKGN